MFAALGDYPPPPRARSSALGPLPSREGFNGRIRLATTSGDGTVKVWDALSDQESLALRPAWPVGKVAWSADGKQIWLSTALGEYVHNTSTGLEVAAFPVSPREWLSWSSERSDGKWLAYRLGGGPVRVCDLLTGRQVRPLAVHERSSTTGAWSPDGKRLALSDCQYGPGADPTDPKRISRTWEGVRIWDTTTWRELLTLTCKIPNGASPPQQVQWSPGGDRIAAMGSAMIWVFDASSGDVVFTSRRPDLQHFASSLAWHPDGKAIAVGEFGGAISVLDSITGRELTTFRGHTPQVTALAWTPDGKRLASGALGVQSEIKVWDAATWNLVLAWRRLPSGGVHSLVWSPDGKRLACAVGGQAKVWDAAPRSSAWGNMAPQNCLWATFLATCADLRWRDTVQALRLAQKAVRADPRKGEYWAALGKAQYRAGNWKDALASLTKSLQLHEGPYVYEWYFLAMTCWQLGQKEQARDWYHKAILWNDKNILPGEALPRFRKEAEEVLGIKPGMRAGAS